uniref:Uncharacterized protein n=1 Tax=Nelumbo nucifera TaxID=4432 RepID=A0A822ZE91_NELNU|nr:TPA_asm: hypothetical protein HUJ06_001113 [Nelumbo nucifera]
MIFEEILLYKGIQIPFRRSKIQSKKDGDPSGVLLLYVSRKVIFIYANDEVNMKYLLIHVKMETQVGFSFQFVNMKYLY